MSKITLLEREQRQGTVVTGSYEAFFGAGLVRVTADMDAPELASDKSLTYWAEFYCYRDRTWKQFGELHQWQGPTAAVPSFRARVPDVEETRVRVIIDTGVERINLGAILEVLPYGE